MTPEQITAINSLCATEIMGWRLVEKNENPEGDEVARWHDEWFDEQAQAYTGWRSGSWGEDIWEPYYNIAQAMEVADKLGWPYDVGKDSRDMDGSNTYTATVYLPLTAELETRATAAAALTLACLKAKDINIPE